jgi:hypothetical protein
MYASKLIFSELSLDIFSSPIDILSLRHCNSFAILAFLSSSAFLAISAAFAASSASLVAFSAANLASSASLALRSSYFFYLIIIVFYYYYFYF